MMRFAGNYRVPTWLACVYLGSNVVLNSLNFYWFGKMIETIKKRFQERPGKKAQVEDEGVLVEGLMDSSTLITEVVNDADGEVKDSGKMKSSVMDGKSVIEIEKTEVRRRKD